MIKSTFAIAGLAALNLSATPITQAGQTPPSINPVSAVELQLANIDFEAGTKDVKTKALEDNDFALRLTLKSGHLITVRF